MAPQQSLNTFPPFAVPRNKGEDEGTGRNQDSFAATKKLLPSGIQAMHGGGLLCALLFGVGATNTEPGVLLLKLALTIVLGIWLVAIAAIDLRHYRVPDVLSLPLVAAGLIVAAIDSPLTLRNHLIGAGVGYLLFALIGEAFFRLRGREGLGLGDAKLLAAAGAWTGWEALPAVLLLASCLGLAFALGSRLLGSKDERIAFAPHLAIAFWLVWTFDNLGGLPSWR